MHMRELAAQIRESYGREGLVDLYGRFAVGEGLVDRLMRQVIFMAGAASCGSGLQVASGVAFRHLETFRISDGVFIGGGAFIQGRHDGTCVIGRNVWIGPQAYFDARDLVLGDHVGWGPGAKVLGSEHIATSIDVPVIESDLMIRPVRIEAWADVGTNAVILPGVTVGKGAVVGAGAVVTANVPPFAVVAGVPARVIRWRGEEEVGTARTQLERAG
ncbi:transferase hexapeptide repeat containing protein [Lutibaculum baratangense AMV1]|uniref:Transferase hexapeptide repeat containing protein n=1 Tax=Lutibaculum baratangense AMV1 TaxID=631454 RepID=V4QTG7_9HYPH|nr:transferase hexapeptide repeat containing protein [Lutibaculum baratangense AMV1]